MLNVLKNECKKAVFSKYFAVGLGIMLLFAVLSGVYMLENRASYNPTGISEHFPDGITEDPEASLFGFYGAWVGGEELSLASTLFFNILPIAAALPFSWSFYMERKTGYIKNIVSRVKKEYYYYSKIIAVFVSGVLVVLIPLILNFLMVSAFVPMCKPFAGYTFYNHVYFGNMWADIFYTKPMLYTVLYMALESFYGGIFALLSFAVTFYINNIFAVQLLPFLITIALGYIEKLIFTSLGDVIWIEFVPTAFIHSRVSEGQVLSWSVILVTAILILFSLATIIIRGKKDEIF